MLRILPIALATLVATPALGQSGPTQAVPAASADATKSDLDRIVCEKEEQIGTRLGARKVCKTVKEWQEQRRIQREDVERVQQNINQNQPGG
jgi:hypothetical protein